LQIQCTLIHLRGHQQAFDIYRKIPDESGVSAALCNIGISHGAMRRYDEAIKYFHQSLEISKKSAMKRAWRKTSGIIGIVHYKQRRYEEALKLLEGRAPAAKVLAGGTDLVLQMKQGAMHPSLVIDLKQIPEVKRIKWTKRAGLVIGAACRLPRSWRNFSTSGESRVSSLLWVALES
jgi:hypothetical protein